MYMSNQNYLRAEDVAEIMGISKAYAYKIMRKLNPRGRTAGINTGRL